VVYSDGLGLKNFVQLYIIRINHNCEYVIAIYSLLQRKTQSKYVQNGQFWTNAINVNILPYNPVKVHLDFEISV